MCIRDSYRYRNSESHLLNGDKLPIDLAANVESLGAEVIRCKGIDDFREAIERVKTIPHTVAIHIESDPLAPVPSSESWWDVPVSQVSDLDSTQNAYKAYEEHKSRQRPYLAPSEGTDK